MKNYRLIPKCNTCRFALSFGTKNVYCDVGESYEKLYRWLKFDNNNLTAMEIANSSNEWCNEHEVSVDGICDEYQEII